MAYKKNEWNLDLLYSSDNDPQISEDIKDLQQKISHFVKKWKESDEYLKDANVLKSALDDLDVIAANGIGENKAVVYFFLRKQQDQENKEVQGRFNQLDEMTVKIINELNFFEIRLSKIEPDQQKIFLSAPELLDYRHYLEKLFESAKHILTEAEEKILAIKSKTSYHNWVEMTSRFLSKEEYEVLGEDGKRTKKPFNEISHQISSIKKDVRDESAKIVHLVNAKYLDVAESEINSIFENKKQGDELRGFSRADASRHLDDDFDSEVVDSLLEAVSSKNSIAQDYYKLKASLFKVDKLKYHERNVPYGEVEKEYLFEDSMALIKKVFRDIDPEFESIAESFYSEGRFDVFNRKGKYGNAFCMSSAKNHPVYILLNHTNKLNDVLTIAHELGHGINDTLMRKQNALNYGVPLSVAEVASTFFEDFVLQELMKEADGELKLSLMMMKLNDDITTIFRQVACYQFEQELHKQFREKGYVAKEEISAIFKDHMAGYMGEAVSQDEGSENWWVMWPHIRSYFYVYSYASGLLISKSMQAMVHQDPKSISKVKEFLSAGSALSPKNCFQKLGIDITDKEFWFRGLGECQSLLMETKALSKDLGVL